MPQSYLKTLSNSSPINDIFSLSYKRPVSISFTPDPTYNTWTLPTSNLSLPPNFPPPRSFSPPPAQKRKVQTKTSPIITATTNESTNYQLTSSSWKDELEDLKKESKSTMETMTKENNIKMTTTINENFNEKLKDFQTTLIKTCEEIIAKQMSIINLNMINTIKVTLEEQRVTPQLLPPSNQQQDITQQPNILQYISPSPPVNTQPISQLTESPLISTEPITNERQLNLKRKQIDSQDSEEEGNSIEANN